MRVLLAAPSGVLGTDCDADLGDLRGDLRGERSPPVAGGALGSRGPRVSRGLPLGLMGSLAGAIAPLTSCDRGDITSTCTAYVAS